MLLRVKDLAVSYHTHAGEVQSVRGVSFDAALGETLAIVGESGCGKSVTARAIMGLIQTPPGEIKPGGEILYEGTNIFSYTGPQWRAYRGGQVSIIFQDALTALNPTMKIGRQIAESFVTHKNVSWRQGFKEAVKLLDAVGIPAPERRARQYPHEFSGGMRQRAMIAIALACAPKLLIADEPTTALDVTIQAQIMDLIGEMRKKSGMALILITHDLGLVAGAADKALIMYGGKILERGNCRDLFSEPRHPYTQALINAAPKLSGGKDKRLFSIPGAPPDLLDPPAGCPFCMRCEYGMPVCAKAEPPETDFGNGRRARCWLHHENAPPTALSPRKGRAG
ncbi:MAG: ABC transporter ATP-binding protein [Treponema sp.]|jgi:oligopeptide transport system ATP-binding protein|nr:ABC transporter ATP-binding protein [Treponema sp.]